MRGQFSVVSVDLLDVGSPVLVGLLQPAPRFLFGEIESRHYDLGSYPFRRTEKDVKGAVEILKEVRAPPADDDHVACARRLADHVLGDLEDRATGIEDGIYVGWVPRRGFGRDHRLAAGGAKRHQQAVEQRTRLLVLRLDLFLWQLEAMRDL